MRHKLTDRYLQSLKPPATGRLDIVDTEARGLVMRVTANGVKSWAIRYSPKGIGQRRASYGRYPDTKLAEARQRAGAIAAAAVTGVDLLAQEAREREEQRKAKNRPQTVADLLDEYVEKHCKPNQRRWTLTERMFAAHVKPALGKVGLAELRRGDIAELLDDLQNKKGLAAQVNRVRGQLLAALNWGCDREYLDVNPAAAVKKRNLLEASRDRVLADAELRTIWRTADRLTEPSRSLIKTLILTGQRRDEVRCMAWSEVDVSRALWTLPGSRNKSGRDHEIPLSPAMVELLEGLRRRGAPVFSTDGERPYAGHGGLKARLDRESGVTGWTFHDLRRTASTGMAALHVPQDTIDRVLNHAKRTLAGTYSRHQYLKEKRNALDAWAERVAFLVGEARDAPNVVELKAAGA
jgi:integrase